MKKGAIFLALMITLTLCGCGSKNTEADEVSAGAAAGSDSSSDLNGQDNGQAPEAAESEKTGAGISESDIRNEADSADNKNGADALNGANDTADTNDADNANGTADANDAADTGNINENAENAPADSETPQEDAPPEYTVTTYGEARIMYASNSVNVRKGPAADYEKVGMLAYGQETTVTGQADTDWYEIVYGEEKAYVSNKYLQDGKPAEEPILALQKELQSQNITDAQLEALLLAAAAAQNEAKPKTAASVQAENQPNAAAAAQPEVSPQPVPEIPPVTEVKNAAGIILVGDSRFVQMQEAVGVNYCTWIAEGGKGYTWLEEKAIPRIDGCVGNGSKILINLGVNDTRNLQKYLTLINAKAAEWTALGATVYYASVNPVWENPYTTKEQVEYFNTQMQNGLNAYYVHWIDSYSYLTSVGYKLVDGLHYSPETSQVIYAYLLSCMG